jgi:hypothetical protein
VIPGAAPKTKEGFTNGPPVANCNTYAASGSLNHYTLNGDETGQVRPMDSNPYSLL